MEKIIALACPSCGAALKVSINQKMAKCDYCEREVVCAEALKAPSQKELQKLQNEQQQQGDDW
ncbi:MAG: hypothetical protein FWB93_01240 [Oscillospiraceae bacterium]|nr:hypothetical protein [Oscillospiraceae bacterium]